MKVLLGDLSANIGGEDIFEPIWNESLHEISNDNDNGVCHIQKLDCEKYNIQTSYHS
jgi:hypothetical protein